MAKKMTLEEMRERDKQLMQQHKEMQELIKQAEAAERAHAAAGIVQVCMEMAEQMPDEKRPGLKEIPDLIRKMWRAYYGAGREGDEGQEPRIWVPDEKAR